ncbi:MAG: GNAT family N-acetyltransferase [Candidatus Binataceae bacterium]
MASIADTIVLRGWQRGDIDSLARYANDRAIWINLRDRFPYPYSRADADNWINHCERESVATQFAIDLHGEAIGGIGIEILSDVHRLTAEIGYWIGQALWGKGIATRALTEMTRYAFARFPLERLQALVFDLNPASARVLEKAGYILEARQRRAIMKDGRLGDALMYVRLRP